MYAASPEIQDFEAQDQAEVYDETHVNEDADEFATAEDMPDVFDVTQALGDARDVFVLDAADFDLDALEDEDIEDDEDMDDRLVDDLEQDDDEIASAELALDSDVDVRDRVTGHPADEAEVEYMADVDPVTDINEDEAAEFESDGADDRDLQELGYKNRGGDAPLGPGSGARAEDVADESHPRQEELLDEGIEETFPASDPVSVKHIT
jgi:hypothetical protein